MTTLGIFLAVISCMVLGSGCAQQQASEQFPAESQMVQVTTEEPMIEVAVARETTVVSPTPVVTAGSPAQAPQTLPADSVGRAKVIQLALQHAKLYTGKIDGKVGPLTDQAIREFQRSHNLKVDGKVGPITWAELAKYASEGLQE